MLQRRPTECPACGHDGITQRRQEAVTELGRGMLRLEEWTCRLCAYTWSRPVAPAPDRWEIA